MSGLDLLRDEDLAPEQERVEEPHKAWRNQWRAISWSRCARCGFTARAGETYWDCCDPVWPSRDAAETSAARQIAYQVTNEGRPLEEHLGAFKIDGEA